MKAVFIALVIFCILLLPVSAGWDTYEGTTQWKVTITDDESGCGGGPKTHTTTVTVNHKRSLAEIGDWGHGPTTAAVKGDRIQLPARRIRDGSGSSQLSVLDLAFSVDCSTFEGLHRWDYADSSMSCSGTTRVQGVRLGAPGCPKKEESAGTMILRARADPDNARKEKQYKEALEKDPQNFWANWDMAELKKKQGKYSEFSNYFDNAVGNENIFEETRELLREEELKRMKLSEFPTADTVPLLSVLGKEVNNWDGGLVYKEFVPKAEAKTGTWSDKLWAFIENTASERMNKAISKVVDPVEE